MTPKADLLLYNARVLTLEPTHTRASAVAVKDGRILAVGSLKDLDSLADAGTHRRDCNGMTLAPGFHDAHCHFLAMASRFLQLDCGPDKAPGIHHVVRLIAQEARQTPPGKWIRSYGYDEGLLKEGRHPNAADLDRAAPEHPVRLEHRTGHATVLNSAAMKRLGIGRNFKGPPQGQVVRDASGCPTGVFLEMNREIGCLMRPFRAEGEFASSVRNANALLLSKGVTAIQDAGAGNGGDQWRTFSRLKDAGALTPRVTMMVGLAQANDEELLKAGAIDDNFGLRLGAVKIMVTSATGALRPSPEDLVEIAIEQHRRGRQLTFHAVEAEAVIAAAQAIAAARRFNCRPDPRHRIEHCAEAPPEVLRLVKDSGATVVTQPGFVYHHGAKYLANVEPGLINHLYPLAGLADYGIPWAASSDAPAAPVDPLLHIQAAATRRTADGRHIGPNQAVSPVQALEAWTIGAARSCFQEGLLGSIRPGKYADLMLLTDDPTETPVEEIGKIGVVMTIVGGRVVWEA